MKIADSDLDEEHYGEFLSELCKDKEFILI